MRTVLKSEKTINEETFAIIRNDFALNYMEANKVDLNEDHIWFKTFYEIGLENKKFYDFATDKMKNNFFNYIGDQMKPNVAKILAFQ